MLQFLIIFALFLNSAQGNLCVTNVVVRIPHNNDIGLVFDLTVTNSAKNEKRETVEFMVGSDGDCTVNTTRGELVPSMSRIYGGNFGAIEPGKTECVSLVWPTVSLFNRVGSCPIQLTATSAQDSIASTKQLLHFDTRYETLDPSGHTLRKRKDFTDCKNWDQDYFRNCTPLNCEERYFGQRNFYNQATGQCEKVSSSSRPGEFYDIYSNEAIDRNNFVTDKELEEIKQGKFDSNYLDLQGPQEEQLHPKTMSSQRREKSNQLAAKSPHLPHLTTSERCQKFQIVTLADLRFCFQRLMDDKKESEMEKQLRKKSPLEISMLTQLYYDWYLPLRAEAIGGFSEIENGTTPNPESVTSSAEPLIDWPSKLDGSGLLLLTLKGLAIILSIIMFQILVILTAYFVVCLSVYGFIELYGLWKSKDKAESLFGDTMSDSSHTEVFTTESLMSHR